MRCYPDDAEVEVTLDPENSAGVIATPQDVREVIGILTAHARDLWSRYQHQPELHGSGPQPIALALNAQGDLLRLGGAEKQIVRLRITPLVELIQQLEALIA